MSGPGSVESGGAGPSVRERGSGSLTRGFLFADLRGYTSFVERHGAVVAADLLLRYRDLVRGLVARYAGAEIRTEGDSFYVVFGAVSAAVECGLAIVEAAAAASADRPAEPIAVGVGVHAGETIETPDGLVGGAVNIAARLCALAGPGEVLVSDTVRALTQTVLPVTFVSRGRRTLKGVAEQVSVYAVRPPSEARPSRRSLGLGRLPLAARFGLGGIILVALGAVVALGFAAIGGHAGLPPGPWKIGVDGPLSGDLGPSGQMNRDAVELAIDQTNAGGGIDGVTLVLDPLDDAGGGVPQDPVRGAANARTFVSDPRVIALIGPRSSKVAMSQIPVTNRAGLLQCSPLNTSESLTKPRYGALDLRSAFPDRINYIRTAPADDIQGPALASFIYSDLAVKRTLVVDDGDQGRGIADRFGAAYTKIGGSVVRRTLNPGAVPDSVLGPLSGPDAAGAVFFGGFTDTGAADVRDAMAATGHGGLPFVSWDGIADGSGAVDGSFIQRTGSNAKGSYMSHATIGPPKADFVAAYEARFGKTPSEYEAAAYACAQVVIRSLQAVASTGPSAAGLREAVRAYAVDPTHRFETAIGTIGFDANGDSLQQFVTFEQVDLAAAGGKGDWVFAKQQDYGPAP